MYGQVCEFWGVDPAAALEPVDDVLAFNLRAGLAMELARERREPTAGNPEATNHLALVGRAHEGSEKLRAAGYG